MKPNPALVAGGGVVALVLVLALMVYLIATLPPAPAHPCESYRNTPLAHVPAGCVSYYQGRWR